MKHAQSRSLSLLFQLGGLILALGFVTIILVSINANPVEAFRLILEGAVGNSTRIASVFVVWVPLVLVT